MVSFHCLSTASSTTDTNRRLSSQFASLTIHLSVILQTTDSFVLWDRIITRQRPSDAVLRIEGAKPKYQWKAPKGTFK